MLRSNCNSPESPHTSCGEEKERLRWKDMHVLIGCSKTRSVSVRLLLSTCDNEYSRCPLMTRHVTAKSYFVSAHWRLRSTGHTSVCLLVRVSNHASNLYNAGVKKCCSHRSSRAGVELSCCEQAFSVAVSPCTHTHEEDRRSRTPATSFIVN